MMKKERLFILTLLIVAASSVRAQGNIDSSQNLFKNSIMLSGTNFPGVEYYHGLGLLFIWKDDNIGVFYRRRLTNHFMLKVGYNQWNTLWRPGGEFQIIQSNLIEVGTMSSVRYKMGDIYGEYCIRAWRRHYVTLGVGASYTKGINIVVDSIYYNPDPPHDFIVDQSPRNAAYFGIVPEVSYDCLVLHNRIGVGIDIRYRKYFGFYFNYIEYGFHTAFNF